MSHGNGTVAAEQ